MEMPSGSLSLRSEPGSLPYMAIMLSFTETTRATGCWRRSARLSAAFRNAETEPVAEDRRTLSRPAATEGNEIAIMRPMMATTTSISIRVTPRVLWEDFFDAEAQRRRDKMLLALRLCVSASKGNLTLLFPTDDIGIDSIAAGLAVGAKADDVGEVAVIAGEFVDVIVPPRIFRDLFIGVGAAPLSSVRRLDAQRLQALLGG